MRILSAVAVLLLVAGCQTTQVSLTQPERDRIEAAALDWSDQWFEAASNLDAEGVTALMDPNDAHAVEGGYRYRANLAEILEGRKELINAAGR